MVNGGHGEENIKLLQKKGIQYSIEQTYSNGVRIGGIENHKSKSKILGTKGQAWFPENWTDDDILIAGTKIANNEKFLPIKKGDIISGYRATGTYNNVVICITKNLDGQIDSIYPKNIQ